MAWLWGLSLNYCWVFSSPQVANRIITFACPQLADCLNDLGDDSDTRILGAGNCWHNLKGPQHGSAISDETFGWCPTKWGWHLSVNRWGHILGRSCGSGAVEFSVNHRNNSSEQVWGWEAKHCRMQEDWLTPYWALSEVWGCKCNMICFIVKWFKVFTGVIFEPEQPYLKCLYFWRALKALGALQVLHLPTA